MSGEHLNEDMLQQYALEPDSFPPEAIAHLAECPQCRMEAAGYVQLGLALRDQPAPEFCFDVAAAVMARLESGGDRGAVVGQLESGGEVGVRGARRVSRLVVPGVIAIVVALPAWLFRKTAYFVFAEMSGAVAWIILAAAGVAVLFSFCKYYRRYQQILHLINQ